MHNKYFYHLHTQVHNLKVDPYYKILACKIEITFTFTLIS
jgi:hypothetical protein